MSNEENAVWAQSAASRILHEFGDSAAIDTADYQICGFFMAAAELASKDKELAARIGSMMEPPRFGVEDQP